jgi:hypothetical protein
LPVSTPFRRKRPSSGASAVRPWPVTATCPSKLQTEGQRGKGAEVESCQGVPSAGVGAGTSREDEDVTRDHGSEMPGEL